MKTFAETEAADSEISKIPPSRISILSIYFYFCEFPKK